jgi:hypothetical protein
MIAIVSDPSVVMSVMPVVVSTDYISKATVINDEEEKYVGATPGNPGLSANVGNKRRTFSKCARDKSKCVYRLCVS